MLVCLVCVFTSGRFFYPSTSITPRVRADSPILERHKLCGHKTANLTSTNNYGKKNSVCVFTISCFLSGFVVCVCPARYPARFICIELPILRAVVNTGLSRDTSLG